MSEPRDIWGRKARLIPDDMSVIDRYLWLAEQVMGEVTLDSKEWLRQRVSSGMAISTEQEWALEMLSLGRALSKAEAEGNVEAAVGAAFWIGRLAERMHWKSDNIAGFDSAPEKLARERITARRALTQQNEGRREANARRARERADRVAHAQELAAPLRERSPDASISQIARDVRKAWTGDVPPSVRTIRGYLE